MSATFQSLSEKITRCEGSPQITEFSAAIGGVLWPLIRLAYHHVSVNKRFHSAYRMGEELARTVSAKAARS